MVAPPAFGTPHKLAKPFLDFIEVDHLLDGTHEILSRVTCRNRGFFFARLASGEFVVVVAAVTRIGDIERILSAVRLDYRKVRDFEEAAAVARRKFEDRTTERA